MTAEQWNKIAPEGTPVFLVDDFGRVEETVTRSVAWNLGHGEPVVLVEGKPGGWGLDRLTIKPRMI